MTTEVTVQPGDTLSHIALRHLGSVARWPEVYDLNRETITKEQNRFEVRRKLIRNEDDRMRWIYPGMVLKLPDGSEAVQR